MNNKNKNVYHGKINKHQNNKYYGHIGKKYHKHGMVGNNKLLKVNQPSQNEVILLKFMEDIRTTHNYVYRSIEANKYATIKKVNIAVYFDAGDVRKKGTDELYNKEAKATTDEYERQRE